MSSSSDTVFDQAKALLKTYKSYKKPTLTQLNTFISGMANLMNTTGLTSTDYSNLNAVMVAVLISSNSITAGEYSFASIESQQMTPVMNLKFMSTAGFIFLDTMKVSDDFKIAYNKLITPFLDNTTTLSTADYQTLWTSIAFQLRSAGVSTTDIATMKTQFDATLTMYMNINTSNLMSATVSSDDLGKWIGDFVIPLQPLLGTKYTEASSVILSLYSNSGMTKASGITTAQFIAASQSALGYLSASLESSEITKLKSSMESYISGTFFKSTTYGDSMALPSSKTLSSSVSMEFGLIALPLTSKIADQFVLTLSPFIEGTYDYTSAQKAEIEVAIASVVDPLNISKNGLNSYQIGDIWKKIISTITPMLNPSGGLTAKDVLTQTQTIFTTFVQSYVSTNLQNILGASVDVHDIWQEFLFKNYYTGNESFTGNYAQEWATAFVAKYAADLGVTNKYILAFGINEMLSSNNMMSKGLSGENFLQMGCEILTFVNNFVTQTELTSIAQNLNDFLITFVEVSNYIASVDEGLEIGAAVVVAVVLIVATVFTAGATSGLDAVVVADVVGEVVADTVTDTLEATADALTSAVSDAATSNVATLIDAGVWTDSSISTVDQGIGELYTAYAAAYATSVAVAGASTAVYTMLGTTLFLVGAELAGAAYGIDVIANSSGSSSDS